MASPMRDQDLAALDALVLGTALREVRTLTPQPV